MVKGRNGYTHVGKLDGQLIFEKDDELYKKVKKKDLQPMTDEEKERFKNKKLKFEIKKR